MDQNSTNGAGSDKRNWRERLGIGAKELPKLSDEFRDAPPMQSPDPGAVKRAPRPPQPVTKPAPMAPRAPARSQSQPAEPAVVRGSARPPDNAAQEALAEKLRAQRAAAEKLAEQRVQAARERAEAKASSPAEAPAPARTPSASPPPVAKTQTPPARAAATPQQPSAPRPKFSFADEEGQRRGAPEAPPRAPAPGPQLSPPRPALGGDRQPPFLRPAQPGLTRSTPPYRPIDGATGYTASPRIQPPPARPYGAEPPAYPGPRAAAARRPPAAEPYVRPPEPRGYPPEEFEEETRQPPRLGRPPAPRGRGRGEDELEEVFEDETAPRQRASARDYQAAYREQEDGYEDERRRSSGPWLILVALLLAALLTGGGIYYYLNFMKSDVAGTGAPGSPDSVPVVTAPEQPVKTAPEQPATDSAGGAPAQRKQIYDRIVGDQEVTGEQIQPTEEVPVQPATDQGTQGAATAPDNTAAPVQIPVPDLNVPSVNGQQIPAVDEPPPLPLPPPPGDQQGSLDQEGIGEIAAASAQPEQGATAPPLPMPPVPDALTTSAPLPPLPDTASEGAASVLDPANAEAPAETAAAAEQPAPPPIKPAAKQVAATKKKATQEPELGSEPVVLVPPAEPAPPAQGETLASTDPISQQGAAPAAEPPKKKKTLLDLFRGSEDTQPAPAADTTQVASLPDQQAAPAPKPAAPKAAAPSPEPVQTASAGGYVVQLSSFRSEGEARSEYTRLSSLYPTVVGSLPQRVSQTKIGGSTRYQLGLGPVGSRGEATRVCSALFSAGETDCIVRGP